MANVLIVERSLNSKSMKARLFLYSNYFPNTLNSRLISVLYWRWNQNFDTNLGSDRRT
jgi:hypothetical protein